eukprot:scaffold42265_cov64-Phaeocystis_antarctica.AAC.2
MLAAHALGRIRRVDAKRLCLGRLVCRRVHPHLAHVSLALRCHPPAVCGTLGAWPAVEDLASRGLALKHVEEGRLRQRAIHDRVGTAIVWRGAAARSRDGIVDEVCISLADIGSHHPLGARQDVVHRIRHARRPAGVGVCADVVKHETDGRRFARSSTGHCNVADSASEARRVVEGECDQRVGGALVARTPIEPGIGPESAHNRTHVGVVTPVAVSLAPEEAERVDRRAVAFHEAHQRLLDVEVVARDDDGLVDEAARRALLQEDSNRLCEPHELLRARFVDGRDGDDAWRIERHELSA